VWPADDGPVAELGETLLDGRDLVSGAVLLGLLILESRKELYLGGATPRR
jgi:hypothetical protein